MNQTSPYNSQKLTLGGNAESTGFSKDDGIEIGVGNGEDTKFGKNFKCYN